MSVVGNGSEISDAFCKVGGAWVRPLEIWGWTPANVLVKAWPEDLAPDPLTGVTVSPSSQAWTLVSGQYRATFTASPIGGSGDFDYNWTVSGGATIISGQGTPSVTVSDTVNDRQATVTCTMTDLTLGGTASGSGTAGTSAPTLFVDVTPATRDWSGAPGGFNTTFSVTATGGTGTYTYNWTATGGATIASGQGTANVTVTGSADGAASTVTCSVSSGSQSASDAGSVAAAVIAPLALSLTPANQNWSGSAGAYSASVQATASGGSGSYGYSWSVTGGTITSGQGTSSITISSATGQSASISCTITDTVLGGTKAASSSIAAKALSASVSPTSLGGSSTSGTVYTSGSATATAAGGSGNYSYQWELVSGSGVSPSTGGARTTDFSAALSQGQTASASWRCRVTDNVTSEVVYTGAVSISLYREYAALSASLSPTSLSGSGTAEPIDTSGSSSVSVSGGSGSYSYQWYAASGAGISPISGTSSSTGFRASGISAGQTFSSSFYCRVTDTVTGLYADTNVVSVSLTCNYVDLSVTASPSSLSGSGNTSPVVTSGAASVATAGGSGNFSYRWEWDEGAATGSIVPTTAFAQSTTFQSGDTQAAGTTRGAGFRCRVTDNVTGQVRVSNSVGVNLTRDSADIAMPPEAFSEIYISTFGSVGNRSFGIGFNLPSAGAPYSYTWQATFDDLDFTQVPGGSSTSSNGYIATTNQTYYQGISEKEYTVVGVLEVFVTDKDGNTGYANPPITAGQ